MHRSRETNFMMDDREMSIWAEGKLLIMRRGGTCSFIPRGALRASVRSLRDGQDLCQPQPTSHLNFFYHSAVNYHIIKPFSLHIWTHHPLPLLIYCLINRLLVSFCISKKSTPVFPPHSAPFIMGWCRETYSSYISCNWSGGGPKVSINFTRK